MVNKRAGQDQRNIAAVKAELIRALKFSETLYRLDFRAVQSGGKVDIPAPKAGQFFMIKAVHAPVLLPRPFGAAAWDSKSRTVSFLIERRGEGTAALCDMAAGASIELLGPLGNPFAVFLPAGAEKIALVSGGTGLAPLAFFSAELYGKDAAPFTVFYAGFKKGWHDGSEEDGIFDLIHAGKFIFASEDGVIPQRVDKSGIGFVTTLFNPAEYDAVFCCGPLAMMRHVAAQCEAAAVPCFVSMEQRMACGVGACLGCVIKTTGGNRRCCADGPVFNATEILWR